jgi:hypothetical protein
MKKRNLLVASMIETLEARRMMSVSLDNGVLMVTGTDNADNIKVSLNGDNVKANVNGDVSQWSVSSNGIFAIRLEALGGADKVNVKMAGNDAIIGSVDLGDSLDVLKFKAPNNFFVADGGPNGAIFTNTAKKHDISAIHQDEVLNIIFLGTGDKTTYKGGANREEVLVNSLFGSNTIDVRGGSNDIVVAVAGRDTVLADNVDQIIYV